MRYYTRFLLVGAASGFFCVFNYAKNGMAQTLADIVMLFGFSSADCQLNQIMEGTYWYMPLFLFQIFYGTYIYRHFCSASIYFFSRCCRRTRWFLKEALTLYLFAVVYLLAVLAGGVGAARLFEPVTPGAGFLPLLWHYLAIHSLFLLATALLINILSVLSSSDMGFLIVEGVAFFCIAAFFMTGELFISGLPKEILPEHVWMILVNPFAHLVLYLHGVRMSVLDSAIVKGISISMWTSTAVFLTAGILVLLWGCYIVNHYDLVGADHEAEGGY